MPKLHKQRPKHLATTGQLSPKFGRLFNELVRRSPGFGQMAADHSRSTPHHTPKHSGTNTNSAQLTRRVPDGGPMKIVQTVPGEQGI